MNLDHVTPVNRPGNPAADGAVEVHLESSLLYDHRGLANATWLGVHDVPFIAAEVALLRASDQRVQNVVVEGMAEAAVGGATDDATDADEQFGAVTYLMQKTARCPNAGGGGRPAEARAPVP